MAQNLNRYLKIKMRAALLVKTVTQSACASLRRVTAFTLFIDIFKVYYVMALSAILCIAPNNHMTHEKIDIRINHFTKKSQFKNA